MLSAENIIEEKLNTCKLMATDRSYARSTTEVDDWLQSQNLETSSKKLADTGEFHLSEQIHLSEHFSNLPWGVRITEDALYPNYLLHK